MLFGISSFSLCDFAVEAPPWSSQHKSWLENHCLFGIGRGKGASQRTPLTIEQILADYIGWGNLSGEMLMESKWRRMEEEKEWHSISSNSFHLFFFILELKCSKSKYSPKLIYKIYIFNFHIISFNLIPTFNFEDP